MTNKKIVIAGGTGFIGQGLVRYLGQNNEIVILGRQNGDPHKNLYSQHLLDANNGYRVRYMKWDGKTLTGDWPQEIDGADMVVNLAGKSVNCRYHKKQRKEILDSRVDATRVLGEAIRSVKNPPGLWINAASTTIYRHTLVAPNDEYTGIISDAKEDNMPYNIIDQVRHKKNKLLASIRHPKDTPSFKEPDLDFSIQVCKRWEQLFSEEKVPSTRKIILRTAISLGRGGVITPYLNLCKFGLGGKHGNGRQMFSWVHIEDIARMICWLFENKKEGIYNCVAPNAVSNASFMKTLRQVTGYKTGLPAATWMLELGAYMIGTETELMLKSRWVIPAKAIAEGFTFKYPVLKNALEEIVSQLPRKAYYLF